MIRNSFLNDFVNPLLLVVTAPSGCGKTTLVKNILKNNENVVQSISYTSRKPRKDEIDGIDYHFISKKKFMEMKQADAFVEFACVHENFYGTSKEEANRCKQLNKVCNIFVTDIIGARKLKAVWSDSVSVFIVPPSMQILEERLIGRKSETKRSLRLRLKNAREEVSNYTIFDYIIVNDDIYDACKSLESIINTELLRCSRLAKFVETLIN